MDPHLMIFSVPLRKTFSPQGFEDTKLPFLKSLIVLILHQIYNPPRIDFYKSQRGCFSFFCIDIQLIHHYLLKRLSQSATTVLSQGSICTRNCFQTLLFHSLILLPVWVYRIQPKNHYLGVLYFNIEIFNFSHSVLQFLQFCLQGFCISLLYLVLGC